jgi:uncharacterized delta-60 repeat protein
VAPESDGIEDFELRMNIPCTIRIFAFLVLVLATAVTGVSQTLDPSVPSPNGTVIALAVQPDGKVLIGGSFTKVGALTRTNIARLNVDGTLDTNFTAFANNTVYALAVQDDGAIVVGGNFTNLAGMACPRLGRLSRNGIPDPSFNPGASNTVYALAIQSDGKILAGGAFTNLNGQTRNYIGRVTKNGAVDSFNPGADNRVMALAIQTNGNIVVGGFFTYLGNAGSIHLGVLDTNGNNDPNFYGEADNFVYSLAIQPDGFILAGGRFTNLTSQLSPGLGRMMPDGWRDAAFTGTADGIVYSMALQADGKILVGGAFSNVAGQASPRIGRLNSDGTLDLSFNASASNNVFAVAIQADGQVLAGGSFTNASGVARTNLLRYSGTGTATQSLALNGSTITWLRGGAGPEVWRTQFEASTNGNGWVGLGAGIRVAGGWQIDGAGLPANSSLRARGFTVGGQGNGSEGLVEFIAGKPVIASAPTNLTSVPATNVLFSVGADGPGPLYYQWQKNGANLDDTGNIFGAHNSSLIVSNVFGADGGGYSVVVSNASGAVTSSVAQLTVLDPFIVSGPASQWIHAGQTGTFTVSVIGTPAYTYQWRKDGTNLNGAIAPSLNVTNAQSADVGNYTVVVGNSFGAVTSSIAALSVNLAFCDSLQQDTDAAVDTFALQPDGQILVGGEFTTLGGSNRLCLGRLHADGTLDSGFIEDLYGYNYFTYVKAFAVQPDENILVGGGFDRLGSKSPLWNVARIDSQGVVDASFAPVILMYTYGFVSGLAIQTNQQIVVAGCFNQFAGEGHTNIGRMNMAGTADSLFNARTEEADYPSQGRIYAMALQSDGKILIGGVFTNMWGQTRSHIGRFNSDGTLDTGFNPGADGSVLCFAQQPDGKILVGGSFTHIGGQGRNRIARLDTNGIVDPTFNPGADSYLETLVLQADGKILMGGGFTNLAGQPCQNIGRLYPDGSVDLTFNPGTDGAVYSLAQQADGSVLVGGVFTQIAGQARKNLARLANPTPATQILSRNGSTITWMRGGSSPEISRASFDASTDGTNWINLGMGTRISGGWQLTNAVLASNALVVRARGLASGGQGNGSSWWTETRPGKPSFVKDSAFGIRTNHFGFNISGVAGAPVIIESSPDLKSWTPMGTNQTGVDPFYFSDPNTVGARRFYRARLQ